MSDIFPPTVGVFLPLTGGALTGAVTNTDIYSGLQIFPKARPWTSPLHPDLFGSARGATRTGTISLVTPTTLVISNAATYSVGMGIYIVGAGPAGATLETYITVIAGTTFTLNDAASTAVSGAVVGHSDTRALQAAIDYVVATFGGFGGVVFLENGQWNISKIKLKPGVLLYGTGLASILKAIPGNTATYMVVNNAVSDYSFGLRDIQIDGNKSATGTTCGGIGYDFTGTATTQNARHSNVYIQNCKGHGIYLKGFTQSMWDRLIVNACDASSLYMTNTADQQFSQCMFGNSGLQGVFDDTAGYNNKFIECESFWSGTITPNANWELQGNGTMLAACRSDDSYGDGLYLNSATRCNIDFASLSNAGAYLKVAGTASENHVTGVCQLAPRRVATCIVNWAASSGSNDVDMQFASTSLPAGIPYVLGTASTTDNLTLRYAGIVKKMNEAGITAIGAHPIFNVSGSILTTTGTVAISSTTLTLTAALDFKNKQGIYIVLNDNTVFETTIASGAGTVNIVLTAGPTSSAATAKEVGHSETTALQAWLDTFVGTPSPTFGSGTAELPAGTYNVSQIKVPYQTWFRGQGAATVLRPLPGNPASKFVLTNKTPVTDFAIHISDLTIDGRNSSSTFAVTPVPLSGGLLLDSTGKTGDSNHLVENLLINMCGGNGLELRKCTASFFANLEILYNDGHGVLNDSLGVDNGFSLVVVGQSGLHGFSINGVNERLTNCKGFYSGRVNSTTSGDNFNFAGTSANETLSGCESQDAGRDGVRLDGCDRINLDLLFDSNAGLHCNLINGATNNRIRGIACTSARHTATGLLSIDATSLNNDIDVTYDPTCMATWALPVVGAGRLDATNLTFVRNGNKCQVFLPGVGPRLFWGTGTEPSGAQWFENPGLCGKELQG